MKAGSTRVLGGALAVGTIAALSLVSEPGRADRVEVGPLFQTADRCVACHNGLVTPAGRDASIGVDWRSSMMANAARDPYWQAAVRREVTDHPTAQGAIEDECSKCHMPMARFEAHAAGDQGQIFAHTPIGQGAARADVLAADGVSCSACHQITAKGFGQRKSFVGGFDIDTTRALGKRELFGPFEIDRGRSRVMSSASRLQPEQGLHVQKSEMCATCHTLYTHSLGPLGQVVGELPEQVPYLEWKHSSYRDTRSCQECHMPVVEQPMPISSVLGQPREGFSRHVFRGGNFFMMQVLGRHRAELGVTAFAQDQSSSARSTVQHLEESAAELTVTCSPVEGDRLEAVVSVANLAGHKLPTAYPSRRVWIHLSVIDGQGQVLLESGALAANGSIQGNDNDVDGALFEPHHDRIEQGDQVQIYEAILADPSGAVTTGLLTATSYVKDNRVLPRGFDKATAPPDIAVQGGAAKDTGFGAGSDTVRYAVSVAGRPGPYRVRAELWYQPVGYRWAHNLGTVDTMETRRFVSYYRAMSSASAALLARAEATVPPPVAVAPAQP